MENTETIKNFPELQFDINSHTIHSKRSLKNLGVQLDYDMSMSSQISQLSKSIYFQLKTIGSVRNYLTKAAAKTLVTTLILSKLDYCNAILSGLPAEKLSKLQVLQNQAAKLITKQKKSVHVTPILKELHWLPVKERIKYKTAVFCFKCLNDTAPLYLKQFLELYNPTRALRSSTDKLIFRTPKQNYKTYGERSFLFFGPQVWNVLPYKIRSAPNIHIFKKQLKHYLFTNAYPS